MSSPHATLEEGDLSTTNQTKKNNNMGFKEVMALRQEGKLDEALTLAREDYAAQADQWSASALFWVLKDISSAYIEDKTPELATPLVTEMEELVEEMGATVNVALDAVETLQKQVVPHYNEIEELHNKLKRNKQFLPIEEGFFQVQEWYDSEQGLHPTLHDDFASIMLMYLKRKSDEFSYDEFEKYLKLYLSLEVTRPSDVHSDYLDLALRAKAHYESEFCLASYISQWDLTNLQSEDWKRKKRDKGGYQRTSLAEETLKQVVLEYYDRQIEGGEKVEMPAPIYQLMMDAQSLFPEDYDLELTQARMNVVDGEVEKALEAYGQLLIVMDEPRAWYEYALLIEDDVAVRAGALAKALQMEGDVYLEYVGRARLEMANCLIQQELFPNALRELDMYAQICLEKAREKGPKYAELMEQIPEGSEADRENKEFYFQHSRPAEEHVYADIPETTMIVVDVIAMRLSNAQKQIVPMLKLMSTEGVTALVTPKMYGVAEGDNRGLVYEVKLLERKHAYTKVLLLTPSEQEAKEVFRTEVARINGYSEAIKAHHLMDTNSRHHYLPGSESEYEFGEFVSFVLMEEQLKPRKGSKQPVSTREFLLLPERLDPEIAVMQYPAETVLIVDVTDEEVEVMTESGNRGFADPSISTIPLIQGDRVTARGFTQRHKNRRTGDITYSFNPVRIEELDHTLTEIEE